MAIGNQQELQRFLAWLLQIQLQFGALRLAAIRGRGEPLLFGYYDNITDAIRAVAATPDDYNLFYGLHPVPLSFCGDMLNTGMEPRTGFRKHHVEHLSLLLVDFDVKGESRRNAASESGHGRFDAPCTDREHNAALQAAEATRVWLADKIGADGIVIATNGAQLIVPFSMPSPSGGFPDGKSAEIRSLLAWLKSEFDDHKFGYQSCPGHIVLDASVSGLTQLAALPGTWKMKGSETRTRPFRPVYVVCELPSPRSGSDGLTAKAHELLVVPPRRRNVVRARNARRTRHTPDHVVRPFAALDALDDPRVCPGEQAVFTRVASVENGGRSAVLQALAGRLGDRGLAPEQVAQQLRAHDAVLGGKLEEVHDGDRYIDRLLDGTALFRYGCPWIIDALGSADVCVGCEMYDSWTESSRSKRTRTFPLLLSSSSSQSTSTLDLARIEIRARLRQWMNAPGAMNGAALVTKGPPGIGKSTLAAAETAELARRKRRTLIVVPRLELADWYALTLGQLHGVEAVVWMGKLPKDRPPMCEQPDLITRFRAQRGGFSERKWVCEAACPLALDCRYGNQFLTSAPVVVTTAAMYRTLCHSTGVQLPDGRPAQTPADFDTLIIDDCVIELYKPEKIDVTTSDLRDAEDLGLEVSWLREAIEHPERERRVSRWTPPSAQSQHASFVADSNVLSLRLAIFRQLQDRGPTAGLAAWRLHHEAQQIANEFISRGEPSPIKAKVATALAVMARVFSLRGPTPNFPFVVSGMRLEVRQAPSLVFPARVVVLDSTTPTSIVQSVLPKRELHVVAPYVPSEARVFQLLSARYAMGSLARSETRNRVFDAVERIVAALSRPERQVAIVCRKDLKGELQGRLAAFPVIGLHYWGSRGSNEVIDAGCNTLVLVGTPVPNIAAIVEDVVATQWDNPDRIRRGRKSSIVGYGAPTEDFATPVDGFEDPRVDAYLRAGREGEMLQMAERLRTRIPRGGTPLLVFILSSHPIPGLPPSRLVENLDELVRIAGEETVE